MIKIENDCVDCGLPCIGISCRYSRATHYYCDRCKVECDTLYDWYGEELCKNCYIESKEEDMNEV